VKTILAAMLVAGCAAAGILKAAELRERPRHLRSLQLGVNFLATEIGSLATPLPQALEMAAQATRGPVALLWASAALELDSGAGNPFSVIWEQCAAKMMPYLALEADDWQVLRGIGTFLGRSDRNDQVAQLRLVSEKLAELEHQATAKQERLARLYEYAGWAIGLGLCLFLI